VTVVNGPDLGIGIVSPSSLSLNGCAYDPNPFDVVATVRNNGDTTATGAAATISLPAGLSLVSGSASQTVGDLAPGASAEVTWSVQTANQTSAQTLSFSVTASAQGAQQETANRTVDVPAQCGTPPAPPVAAAQSVSTDQDTPVGITLSASDPNGDTLNYSVVSPPSHGTLSGTAPNVTYTPAAGYVGPDSFTFKANDGSLDSNIATVSIDVRSTTVNRAPVADSQSINTPRDTPVPIRLTGSDADGDALAFAIMSPPLFGTLSGTAPDLVYTPNAGYTGPDSFTFTVNDGKNTSTPAAVSITVVKPDKPRHCDSGGHHRKGSCRCWHVDRSRHRHLRIWNRGHAVVIVIVWINGRSWSLGEVRGSSGETYDLASRMTAQGPDNVTVQLSSPSGIDDVRVEL
jgi:hypothetical protein